MVKKTRETYDTIAQDYSASVDRTVSGWVGEFEQKLLDRFLLMINLFNPKVLDIGCGNGKDTHYLKTKRAAVMGIDISSGMLQKARKRVSDYIFCQMDMRNLAFFNGVFDGVWANGCVYHVPKADLTLVLREILRILKASGIFSFNFKVGTGEGMEENPRSFGGSPRFYAYYRTKEMRMFLKQAGFEILGVTEYPKRIFGERIVHMWTRKLF